MRSASRHRGIHGVDDTQEYHHGRDHGRQDRCRALAFTHVGRRCRRGASSSAFPFDAACYGTLRHGRRRGCRLSSLLRRGQHQLRKTRMRNFTHICGASLIDTDWIACSSRMRRVNTTTRLGREATIIRSTSCIPRIWKRGAPTIETCIPYSRGSQPR